MKRVRNCYFKLCLWAAVGFLIGVLLASCTAQQPIAQSPVYNITYTDNSQTITGDNNAPISKPDTVSDQTAKPVATTTADNTVSMAWLYWLIITLIVAVGGYFAWKKWVK